MRRDEFFLPRMLLIIAWCVSIMGVQIYTPCLPLIGDYFQVGDDTAQQLMSYNFFGLSISGFFYGPLSECYGRRRIFIIGFCIFLVGALVSTMSVSIEMLILSQLFQGIGAGVSGVLLLSVIQDVYKGVRAAQIISSVGMVIPLAPAIAPVIGGYITNYFGWRANFLFLAIAIFLILILCYHRLPETLPKEKHHSFSPILLAKQYMSVLRNMRFLGCLLIVGLGFACIAAFQATTPFVFIEQYGIPVTHYGYYTVFAATGVILGNFFVHRLVKRFSLKKIMKIGSIISTIAASLILLGGILQLKSAIHISLFMHVFCVGIGMAFSTATTMAMETHTRLKGYSAAAVRSFQMLAGAGAIAFVGEIYNGTLVPLGVFMVTCALIIATLSFTIRSSGQTNP